MASTVKRAFSTKPNYAGHESWEALAEQCRLATAKDLRCPEEELKKMVRPLSTPEVLYGSHLLHKLTGESTGGLSAGQDLVASLVVNDLANLSL